MKSSIILAAIAAMTVCLLMAVTPAWGSPGRAVYANGLVHKICDDGCDPMFISYGDLQMNIGTVSSTGVFTPNVVRQLSAPWSICRASDSGPRGESLAVFNNKIYYAYTAYVSCTNAALGTHAFVATFDLTTRKWISPPKDLGPVAWGTMGGAAITVFDNQLYVITDSSTWTSGDGAGWTLRSVLSADKTRQPLDAITIYPPDTSPRILIVYGTRPSTGSAYTGLSSANWNGQFGASSDFTMESIPVWYSGMSINGRVSLLAGTMSGGAKTPVVQLFAYTSRAGSSKGAFRHATYAYTGSTGTWALDAVVMPATVSYGVMNLVAFSSSTFQCDPAAPANQTLHQTIYANWSDGESWKAQSWDSDYLVPKNPVTSCDRSGGLGTDTSTGDTDEQKAIRRNYWSLAGVVLGSPPFGLNGVTDTSSIAALSMVRYGQDASSTVTHTQEWSNSSYFSSGMQLNAGLFDIFSASASYDSTYRHGWESSHSNTSSASKSVLISMGTESAKNAPQNLGRFGWAIFNVPVIMVQDWWVFAYDYNSAAATGTALNQDLHTVESSPTGLSLQQASFELSNPGGPSDTYPGLMAGMPAYAPSTNLSYWAGKNWEIDNRWRTLQGNGTTGESKMNPLVYTASSSTKTSLSSGSTTADSTGETKSSELSVGMDIGGGTGLLGFKTSLKAGEESSMKMSVENSSSFTNELSADLVMNDCAVLQAGCVTSLVVQPYFLQAVDKSAPWIPTAYNMQLPWCVTWKVTDSQVIVGGLPSRVNRFGHSPAPFNAFGRVVSGSGGEAGGGAATHYTIEGGRMAWEDDNGQQTRIPMTADQFVPSRGVFLDLNGFSWSSLAAKGNWTRAGNIWMFQPTGPAQQPRVQMKLDFDSATFDVHVTNAEFERELQAAVPGLQLTLTVNEQYKFHSVFQNDFDITWRWSRAATQPDALEVTSFQGRFDSVKKTGNMAIAGTLPSNLQHFGDMGLETNGRETLIPLSDLDNFEDAVRHRGVLRYAKEGLIVVVDFGTKTWSATFNNQAFHELLAPRFGMFRTRIHVGGIPWHRSEEPIVHFTSQLKLRN